MSIAGCARRFALAADEPALCAYRSWRAWQRLLANLQESAYAWRLPWMLVMRIAWRRWSARCLGLLARELPGRLSP